MEVVHIWGLLVQDKAYLDDLVVQEEVLDTGDLEVEMEEEVLAIVLHEA